MPLRGVGASPNEGTMKNRCSFAGAVGAWLLAAAGCAATAPAGPSSSADAGISADTAPVEVAPPAPTCTDGQKNGSEVGVDCGGACGPCGNGQPCGTAADCSSALCKKGKCVPVAWLIGGGDKNAVKFTTVLSSKLSDPTALAFHPTVAGQLWVANRKDDSLTIADGVTIGEPSAIWRFADAELHFLESVDAISFAADGNFGTCGDTRNSYHGNAPADDFMGPVEWPGSVDDFEAFGPDASKVHLDMMHDTPFCMGIASGGGTTYYVFNGIQGTIDWYDFGKPHPNGGTNHTDGAKKRYSKLGLKRVANVPSHLAFDAATKLLYIADTGNGRVVTLDTTAGAAGKSIQLYPDEVAMQTLTGATVQTLTDGLDKPSGVVLFDGFLYFSDAGSSLLFGVSLDGTQGVTLDTGLPAGALAGVAVGPDERLYFVDRKANAVRRVDVL